MVRAMQCNVKCDLGILICDIRPSIYIVRMAFFAARGPDHPKKYQTEKDHIPRIVKVCITIQIYGLARSYLPHFYH